MELNTILIAVCSAAVFLFLLTLVLLQLMNRKAQRSGSVDDTRRYRELLQPTKGNARRWLIKLCRESYEFGWRVPPLRMYMRSIRRRIARIHAYDESTMRLETMKLTYMALGILCGSIVALVVVSFDLSFMIAILLGALVVHGLLIDAFIHRVENRLLRQLVGLFADVRHHYHQHGMVEEAIYEAAELGTYEASLHAHNIYELLVSADPEAGLEQYYEAAPNRFLKGFAGISHLIREFGDKVVDKGSLYLNALNRLTQEIHLEILRRERLDYLLKGLTAIAVAPILFAKPIEYWARGNFPAMDDFYAGKLGAATKVIIYAIILIAYVLLRKMQDNDEGKANAGASRRKRWEQVLAAWRPVSSVVGRFLPAPHSKAHVKLNELLKTTHSPLTPEWFMLRRIMLGAACFAGAVTLLLYMHSVTVDRILFAPTQNEAMFGRMSPKEEAKAIETSEFDRRVIDKVSERGVRTQDAIAEAIREQAVEPNLDREAVIASVRRISAKLDEMNGEYFKWWELLLGILAGTAGYYVPLWILYFQLRLRQMELQREVDEFHTILAILCEMERISVENMVEWMERFSVQFRQQLRSCLLNYESGAEQALEQLKEDASFIPFARIVERLLAAADKIPVKQAFDDLETERQFYFEQRKQQYEKTIESKASWGKLIGFAPMYALVFLYLVLPLVYMSMNQMSVYYEQIGKIT